MAYDTLACVVIRVSAWRLRSHVLILCFGLRLFVAQGWLVVCSVSRNTGLLRRVAAVLVCPKGVERLVDVVYQSRPLACDCLRGAGSGRQLPHEVNEVTELACDRFAEPAHRSLGTMTFPKRNIRESWFLSSKSRSPVAQHSDTKTYGEYKEAIISLLGRHSRMIIQDYEIDQLTFIYI